MPVKRLQSRRSLHQNTDIAIFSRDYHVAKRHAINGALQTTAAMQHETHAEA
jgi:hypothetical protein